MILSIIFLILISCFNSQRSIYDISVLLYMGSPDLNSFSDDNATDISSAFSSGKNPGLEFNVFIDGRNKQCGDEIPESVIYCANNYGLAKVRNLGESKSAKIETFIDVFDKTYSESLKRSIIFWGHSTGVQHREGDQMQIVVTKNKDSTCLEAFSIDDLKKGLQHVIDRSGSKIDLLGFDACNMMCIEFIYEMRDYAEYIVASQNQQDAFSWRYGDMAKILNRVGSNEISHIIASLVDSFSIFYRMLVHEHIDEKNDINDTISVVETQYSSVLRASFLNFVDKANQELESNILKRISREEIVDSVIKPSRISEDSGYIDMVTFVKCFKYLLNSKNIHTLDIELEALREALSYFIYHSYSLDDTVASKGLSIRDLTESIDNEDTTNLSLYQSYSFDIDNNWIKFLMSIFTDRSNYFHNSSFTSKNEL